MSSTVSPSISHSAHAGSERGSSTYSRHALVRMTEKNSRYMKLEPGREMALLFRTSLLEIEPLEWLEKNLVKLIK